MVSSRSIPNHLAGPYLERLAGIRKDEARLRAALANPTTRFVPVWRTHSCVVQTHSGIAAQFVMGLDSLAGVEPDELILLGEFRGELCFAAELPSAIDPPATDVEFRDLRLIAGELDRDEAGLLAYARALVLWRERHRYCGRCGAHTVAMQGGHVRQCSDERCGNQQFPRIDPAVIVLVTDDDRALLGRQAAWPPGRYSTIAGFVEPGESLEDAVAREVLEETGIRIASVYYHSSQPWPFPSSLMLGFTAQAATTDIQRSDDELEDVRWITRSQIADGEIALPPPHSISFRLIEDWYDEASAVSLRQEPRARRWSSPVRRDP